MIDGQHRAAFLPRLHDQRSVCKAADDSISRREHPRTHRRSRRIFRIDHAVFQYFLGKRAIVRRNPVIRTARNNGGRDAAGCKRRGMGVRIDPDG